ncbi:hypothetical protein [Parapedobacter sp. 10938]|uniref:hypothetical protein n=1 Tax=Parapedobacter flavus TaxID=3110225 RepID=UPI002DBAE083|nr:hypothetical protein [Parapedobacter sp. 10938]MEC3879220.1 hypothetical protein [Parapedobacter sp. 10938]
MRNEKYDTAAIGKVTLRVSGALNKTHNGHADFDVLELNGDVLELSSAKVWVINMRDEWIKTFSFQLSLSTLGHGNITQPVPGSYPIGLGSHRGTPVFSASYSHIVNDDILHIDEYDTLHRGSGKLIIETANDRKVSGSFMFTAHGHDDSSISSAIIEISGEFTAGKAV